MSLFSLPAKLVDRVLATLELVDNVLADTQRTVRKVDALVTRVDMMMAAFNRATAETSHLLPPPEP